MSLLTKYLTHEPHRMAGVQVPRRMAAGKVLPRSAMKKILLADDDPGVREMLGRVLESEGYEVIVAQDGNEAAVKFATNNPDLVLLDLNMPVREGWSAFHFIHDNNPLLPVIIITARPEQYPKAKMLGIDALMEKPLNYSVLMEAIKNLLLETEDDRVRRLADPHFQTAYLTYTYTISP